MSAKLKLNVVRLSGCSGCYRMITNFCCQSNNFGEILEKTEINYGRWLDKKDIKKADVTIIEGNLVSVDDYWKLQQIVDNSDVIIGIGSCTVYGGLSSTKVLESSFYNYKNLPEAKLYSNYSQGIFINDLINFDYFLPGCPISLEDVQSIIDYIVNGYYLEKKEQVANLCKECSRTFALDFSANDVDSVHKNYVISTFSGINFIQYHEADEIDEIQCFLEQGIVCLGLITSAGCQARCIEVNVPCHGCLGSESKLIDRGVKLINSLSSFTDKQNLQVLLDSVESSYLFKAPNMY